ncbi:MAG TPA: histone deacetylase [Candidatus Omnitrophica bacterium]|nr:histone deacetylase [Candidatus Omnitrophota bacterium]
MKIIYSPKYEVDIGAHVFPTVKYRLIKERLISGELACESDFIQPEKASLENVALVHTKDYINKLNTGTLSYANLLKLELPYSKELAEAAFVCVGGTILTARRSLNDKISVHLGGGFHHAYPDHGEGFCVFNDPAVAIRVLQKEGLIKKGLVFDVDLHQGNGTANIFDNDSTVFTFSIHQEQLYPLPKERSSLDIGLDAGTNDDVYIKHLEESLPKIIKEFRPDFAIYLSGADPYKFDQLGNLELSLSGLKRRDEFVLGEFYNSDIPVAVVFGGGYALNVLDTVEIHSNTVKAAYELVNRGKR